MNLIIGAGPVGLYLCRRLLQDGQRVTLIEQRSDISLVTRTQILLINNYNLKKD
jgi:2-polyprenyl-6-methoxyphenol hydroxylase-like FAD-dependent oxidoreductase